MTNTRPTYKVTVPHREPRYFRTLQGAAKEADRWSEHYGNEPRPEYGYRDQVAVWWRGGQIDNPNVDACVWHVMSPDRWIAELPHLRVDP